MSQLDFFSYSPLLIWFVFMLIVLYVIFYSFFIKFFYFNLKIRQKLFISFLLNFFNCFDYLLYFSYFVKYILSDNLIHNTFFYFSSLLKTLVKNKNSIIV